MDIMLKQKLLIWDIRDDVKAKIVNTKYQKR